MPSRPFAGPVARTAARLTFRATIGLGAGLLSVLTAGTASAGAQLPAPAAALDTAFVRYTAMIPMRDGVRLNTEIFIPKRAAGPLPILLTRTPYGVGPTVISAAAPGRALYELAQDGYVIAAQDLRGRFKSEGQFVMMRPPRDPKARGAVDEASDAYDTVDWLVKHVPHTNGRVGIFGISYGGWTAAMALLDPHPALRAASPQASPADMFLGDDFHHNGAFRLSYGFEYAAMMESSKENDQFAFDTYDTYDWYLRLGPLSTVNARYLHGKIPTWNDFVAHPNYDAFWRRQTIVPYLTTPLTVPTLTVAGWWDQEDFYGPLAIYQALERQDPKHNNFLVVGPWNHGGWSRSDGATLGKVSFGAPTSRYFREQVQAPFFRCHLKGRCDTPLPKVTTFEAGANAWRTYAAWPPTAGVARRALYLGPNGTLTWEAPAGGMPNRGTGTGTGGSAAPAASAAARDYDEYVSDPARPVPYRQRPIEATYDPRGSGWYTWQTDDQRFAATRPDVLSWVTAPLAADVTIAGDVQANLFASTSGTDADWVVKLIDVYPDVYTADPKMSGYELMVSGEVFRARFRNSFTRPEPVVPNAVTPYRIGLHGQDYQFKRGHRIMVQVQSSWFPIIDRNPQTFVPNIFEAKAGDFRPATQRVYRAPAFASHVSLPVKAPDDTVPVAKAPNDTVAGPKAQGAAAAQPQPPRDYSAPPGAPYTAEEVTVRSPAGHTLAGTLTLPKGAARGHPVGAVVTITGSGPQDRDENLGLGGFRMFRQLADSLGRRGIAVLRMDDRGVGRSTGTFKRTTSAEFGEDIRAGLAYLRTRPEVDARRLGVVGHSEGAVIAPMVANKEPTLRAMVLLAGVARPARSALQFQMENRIKHDTALTGARRDAALAAVPQKIDSMMAADPWMDFFLTYDPTATARRVRTPVLILTGANDQQADPRQVPEQAAAFRAAGNPDVTARVVPGVNHLFVNDPDGFPGNYTKLPAPVMVRQDVVGTVVDWLAQRLK